MILPFFLSTTRRIAYNECSFGNCIISSCSVEDSLLAQRCISVFEPVLLLRRLSLSHLSHNLFFAQDTKKPKKQCNNHRKNTK